MAKASPLELPIPIWPHRSRQRVKYKFIKTTFIKKIQFHQNPLSSRTKFIKKQFHRISNWELGQNQTRLGWQKQSSPYFCESRRHFHRNAACAFNRPSRPKAGDAPRESLLKVEVCRCLGVQVFRCSGVQVFRCLGFGVLEFGELGFSLGFQGLR